MTWIKLDDDFTENPKFLRAGPLAGYLHIAAIAWSRHNLTDGVVPRSQPGRLVAWHVAEEHLNPELVGKLDTPSRPIGTEVFNWATLVGVLVEQGLWHERADGDYEIHDYLKHQDSREKVEREQERKRVGMQGLRATRKDVAPPQDRHDAASGTLERREKREETTTTIETAPQSLVDVPDQTQEIFDEWVTATGRPAGRTKLTPDRRRLIDKAKRSHGFDDCILAVRHIGADAWARGENDRGQRYDDIKHALGNAEKLERWRDATAPPVDERTARRERGRAALNLLTGGKTT